MTYQSSDGDSSRIITQDLQSTFDSIFSTEASLAPGPVSTRYNTINLHLNAEKNEWQINWWGWQSQSGVGAGAAQSLDPNSIDDSALHLTNISYSPLSDTRWKHTYRINYQHYDIQAHFNLLPPGSEVTIGADGNLTNPQINNSTLFSDGLIGHPGARTDDVITDFVSIYETDIHKLRINLGARYQSIKTRESKNYGPGILSGNEEIVNGVLTDITNTSLIYVQNTHRTIKYISIQDEWNFNENLSLTVGLRNDLYSDFGSTKNPRAALIWQASSLTNFKLLYGKAFRAPSFGEQYFQNNPVSLGNKNLAPEEITTYELVAGLEPYDGLSSTLSVFNYRASNLIEYLPDEASSSRTAQNSLRQDGYGFEWEVYWQTSKRLHIKSNFSYQRAQNAISKNDIPDAPTRHFTVNASWSPFPQWHFNTILNHIADRKRAAFDTRPKVSDYTLVDITTLFEGDQFDISFGIRNITNADAREPSSGFITEDYPLESRSYWAEVRYTFR